MLFPSYTLPEFECAQCREVVAHATTKHTNAHGQVCRECWCAGSEGNEACTNFAVQNPGNLDAMDKLRGRAGGRPLISEAKARAYQRSIGEDRTAVRRHRRENRSSRLAKDIQRTARIPAEIFHDPNGPYGNSPGESSESIAKKLRQDGLLY